MPIIQEGQYCSNCQQRELATICLACDAEFNRNSLFPLARFLKQRYNLNLHDAITLAKTIDLLVLGYERAEGW